MHYTVTILIIVTLLFSEEMTELKIQIETGFETEQDLKKSLQQLEGKHTELQCVCILILYLTNSEMSY